MGVPPVKSAAAIPAIVSAVYALVVQVGLKVGVPGARLQKFTLSDPLNGSLA